MKFILDDKGIPIGARCVGHDIAERKKTAAQFPNLVDYEGRKGFQHFYKPAPLPVAGTPLDDVLVTKGLFRIKRTPISRPFRRSSSDAAERRRSIRIGIPRVLTIYSVAPFIRTYLEALGIPKTNVVFSEATSEDMWIAGGKYGSVDPCFPSKVVQSHIHQLLFEAHQPAKGRALRYIFFPVITHTQNFVEDTMDNTSCPIVAGTPDVMRAAFTKETDFFASRNIEYLAPGLNFMEPNFLAQRMFECWGNRLEVTEDESDFACREAWKALRAFQADLEDKGRAILETVENENRLAILVIGRPYHSDPGLNHGIPDEFQALGYPILSIRSIPKAREFLDRYYSDELKSGAITSPLQLSQVWPENYSVNSSQKVWAANFAAHHPNVAVLDLSSFKCGHDAPTYGLIDTILQTTRTPVAALHDLDANKPGGSIKIRVKTYAHALRLERERLEEFAAQRRDFEWNLDKKRLTLLEARQDHKRARAEHDAQLELDLANLRRKVSQYAAPAHAVDDGPKLVQLRRKQPTQPSTLPETTAVPLAAE